jgi:PAS domain S-box-containing protein
MSTAWRLSMMLILATIMIYGFLAASYMLKSSARKEEGRWLLVSMLVFALLFVFSVMNTFNSELIEKWIGAPMFFPLNLNHLAFIIIMSLRLQKNTLNKYRLEKILRTRNKQWDTLFKSIDLLSVEVDKSGKIIYVNPFAVKHLGYKTQQEILGLHFVENFIPETEIAQGKSSFNAMIEGGIVTKSMQSKLKAHNGTESMISWTCVLVTDENDRTTGILCIGKDITELDTAFRRVQELKNELEKENLFLREVVSDNIDHEIIGKSEAIIYTIQKARQVSPTNATVLLEGETGVGKELFADLIHKAGLRSTKPLVKVNCAALPPELIESELFGHEKGSFTGALQSRKGRFELADGGTIFLDEIGEMPLTLQPKLLRVLQSGEFERIGGQTTIKVDVRVISATNRDLLQDVKAGRFREDLFYRLNVYPITVPSLRNRKEDIPLLTDYFIKKYSLEFNKHIENISRADMNRLIEYNWPGNIRELINLIERSIITSNGETLKIDWEQNHHHSNLEEHHGVSSIKDLEREHILRILKECNGKINGPEGAAEKLGINPNTLRSRMKKLNITRD